MQILDNNFLEVTAIFTIFYQAIFFFIAAICRHVHAPDFAASTNLMILAWLTAVMNDTWFLRQVLMILMVTIWGLRLVTFLCIRLSQPGMRHRQMSLSILWILQTILVWVMSIPVTIVNASEDNPPLEAREAFAWLMWIIGLIIEVTADWQLFKFMKFTEGQAKWCNIGVWSVSRHPNIFGEILLWWGIFVSSTPLLHGGKWAIILCPMVLTGFLLFVHGIPTLEVEANDLYKHNPDYHEYKLRTSPLIPFPSRLYCSLPSWIKRVFFFEFPLYQRIS